MLCSKTILILTGFQNDYYAQDGVMQPAIGQSGRTSDSSSNTLALLECLAVSDNTAGQSVFEHRLYCEQTFPLYVDVLSPSDLAAA